MGGGHSANGHETQLPIDGEEHRDLENDMMLFSASFSLSEWSVRRRMLECQIAQEKVCMLLLLHDII